MAIDGNDRSTVLGVFIVARPWKPSLLVTIHTFSEWATPKARDCPQSVTRCSESSYLHESLRWQWHDVAPKQQSTRNALDRFSEEETGRV